MKESRLTAQKLAILDYLRRFQTLHPTPEMVFRAVSQSIPHVSLATVYRNLDFLAKYGYIEKITGSNREPRRYDSRVDPHLHFRCDHCKGIFDVDDSEILSLLDQRFLQKGFFIEHAAILYSGWCQNCFRKGKKKEMSHVFCTAYRKIDVKQLRGDETCEQCRFQVGCRYYDSTFPQTKFHA